MQPSHLPVLPGFEDHESNPVPDTFEEASDRRGAIHASVVDEGGRVEPLKASPYQAHQDKLGQLQVVMTQAKDHLKGIVQEKEQERLSAQEKVAVRALRGSLDILEVIIRRAQAPVENNFGMPGDRGGGRGGFSRGGGGGGYSRGVGWEAAMSDTNELEMSLDQLTPLLGTAPYPRLQVFVHRKKDTATGQPAPATPSTGDPSC
ncbi:unnamed protein product [Vitrella brassicaformis CCMP3155]|uniref:Uncharacterized protein n=1 Tax=Vitrella brassicaformis (strain CCMP3155) TaxID=1169540 RepID=A0A0G4ERM9_VITBC|nr:unnamed protein product [Vitrella brassicaformis CCMP3155]|eukprot:CEM00527.1 unnamed protein product [Vitrella brassicaformis CCMP3155]